MFSCLPVECVSRTLGLIQVHLICIRSDTVRHNPSPGWSVLPCTVCKNSILWTSNEMAITCFHSLEKTIKRTYIPTECYTVRLTQSQANQAGVFHFASNVRHSNTIPTKLIPQMMGFIARYSAFMQPSRGFLRRAPRKTLLPEACWIHV